jgi:tetratricopeptide (TPR) repeat protein
MDAHLEKGISLYQLKKYPEALNAFDIALQVSGTFADAYYWKGRVQEAMGLKEEAKQNYQRALGLDREFTAAREALEKQ